VKNEQNYLRMVHLAISALNRQGLNFRELEEFLIREEANVKKGKVIERLIIAMARQLKAPKTEISKKEELILAAMLMEILSELKAPNPSIGSFLWSLTHPWSKNRRQIARPPGIFLSRIAEFFLSRRTLEHLVYPILSDLQIEYCDALAQGRRAKAIWVRVRGYWAFCKALGLHGALETFAELLRRVKAV